MSYEFERGKKNGRDNSIWDAFSNNVEGVLLSIILMEKMSLKKV